jgi:peptide/nickel transport system substrate-binding protein
MKNRKLCILAISVMLVFLASSMSPATSSVSAQPAREDILWTAGYWALGNIYNPYRGDACQTVWYMFEPCGALNSEKSGDDQIIYILAEDDGIEWSDDGTELTVTIRDEAKWSDGEDIDAEDFAYTLFDAGARTGGPRASTWGTRVDSVETDGKVATINLKSGWTYSKTVWLDVINVQVLPKHVCEDVEDAGVNIFNWENNWQDDNDTWQVYSGMYYPHSIADDKSSWILAQKNTEWWGTDAGFDEPEPDYLGMLKGENNYQMALKYSDDQIDWCGTYVSQIWDPMSQNGNLVTYYGNGEEPYYSPTGSYLELMCNWQHFPMGELWFRRAMGHCIRYSELSNVAASGFYGKQPHPGWISNDTEAQAWAHSDDVENEYALNYDLDLAKEYMAEGCLTTGDYVASDCVVTVTAEQLAKYNNIDAGDDCDSELAGVQIDINSLGLTIEAVTGWSDHELATKQIKIFAEPLGLSLTEYYPDYGGLTADIAAGSYDLMVSTLGPRQTQDPIVMFNYHYGSAYSGANRSAWTYDGDYNALVKDYEVAEPGSDAQLEAAEVLQEILAENLPCLPIAGSCLWNAHSNRYWKNWPQKGDDFPETAMWQGPQPGLLQEVLRMVEQSDGKAVGPPSGASSFAGLFAVIGLLGLAIYLSKKRR